MTPSLSDCDERTKKQKVKILIFFSASFRRESFAFLISLRKSERRQESAEGMDTSPVRGTAVVRNVCALSTVCPAY